MQFDNSKVKNHPKLSGVVYTTIKRKLISQDEWNASGVKLQERQLAHELGVSRTPIREAIHKLEKDGLIYTIPRRGAFLRILSPQDVREIFEIRGVLESLVLRSFFSCLDKKSLLQLRRSFEQCERLVKKGKLDSLVQVDEEFHRFLIRCSNNSRLIQIMENLTNQMRVARLKSFSVPGRARRAIGEHKRIIDAMLARHKTKAEKLVLQHSENAKQNILSLIERNQKRRS